VEGTWTHLETPAKGSRWDRVLEDSTHLETLPVAPEAGQVIVSLSQDLGPAWLGEEPVAQAVATAAKDADQNLQIGSDGEVEAVESAEVKLKRYVEY
jgi:hypothetical protein